VLASGVLVLKLLCFMFWSAVTCFGFGYMFHSFFGIGLFSPFILLVALFTVAASRSSAE
jgi:hypothetical protein